MKIAVRDLAKVFQSGDLSIDFMQNNEEPKEAHQFIQNQYNENEHKEFYVKRELIYQGYDLVITGLIDGVLENNTLEEIKSTSINLDDISLDYHKEHLAQLKIYGYLYSCMNQLPHINLKLTYISLSTYETKHFIDEYNFKDLEKFFYSALDLYLEFIILEKNQSELRESSIKQMTFPYNTYRLGQRDLMKNVFYTIKSGETLYAIAPTGIGKTLATLFSSLKALTNPKEKIFYLTAKTIGKQIALNTINLLFENKLRLKAIELTAKDKVCLKENRNCDPEKCKYAKGYYDRLNTAIKDIYDEKIWDTQTILGYANKHSICPFEFSLDLSYYADIIIGDYNYAFCPFTHLIRYFDDDKYLPILLIDEAHNLINRSREMYSSSIKVDELKELIKFTTKKKPSIKYSCQALIKYIESLNITEPITSKAIDEKIIRLLKQLTNKLEILLNDNLEFKNRNEALSIYFNISRFIKLLKYYDDSFIFFYEDSNTISIKCLDASKYLLKTLERTNASVFFSATLEPISYYKNLLTKGKGNDIAISSPFDKNNLKLIIKSDISTKYNDREKSIPEIIRVIDNITKYKTGNYIVFFPSYKYLNMVKEKLINKDYEVIFQKENMTEDERSEYINMFTKPNKTKVFLFIMGGSFSEGIDYIGDMLNGVIVVSVGLPMLNLYNNTIKDYFNEINNQGFDYAYTLPGMNKVIQAVGRVIRSESDRGIAILIDERFKTRKYISLMPNHWNINFINDNSLIEAEINKFKEKEIFNNN